VLESRTALRQWVATVIAAPPDWLLTGQRNRPNSDFIQYWVAGNDAEFRVTVIKSLLSIHRSSLVRTWWRRAKCLFRPAIELVVVQSPVPQHVAELIESESLEVQVTNIVTIRIIITICAILLLTPSVLSRRPASVVQWSGRWRHSAAPVRVPAVLRSPAADAQHRGVPATATAGCSPPLPRRTLQSPRWRTMFGRRISPGAATSKDWAH